MVDWSAIYGIPEHDAGLEKGVSRATWLPEEGGSKYDREEAIWRLIMRS
jgi:hypothetical protein